MSRSILRRSDRDKSECSVRFVLCFAWCAREEIFQIPALVHMYFHIRLYIVCWRRTNECIQCEWPRVVGARTSSTSQAWTCCIARCLCVAPSDEHRKKRKNTNASFPAFILFIFHFPYVESQRHNVWLLLALSIILIYGVVGGGAVIESMIRCFECFAKVNARRTDMSPAVATIVWDRGWYSLCHCSAFHAAFHPFACNDAKFDGESDATSGILRMRPTTWRHADNPL